MLPIILVNSPWKLFRDVYFGEKAVFKSSESVFKITQVSCYSDLSGRKLFYLETHLVDTHNYPRVYINTNT